VNVQIEIKLITGDVITGNVPAELAIEAILSTDVIKLTQERGLVYIKSDKVVHARLANTDDINVMPTLLS